MELSRKLEYEYRIGLRPVLSQISRKKVSAQIVTVLRVAYLAHPLLAR